MKAIMLCVLVTVSTSGHGTTAQPLAAAMAVCRAVLDASARLTCYDAIEQPKVAHQPSAPIAAVNAGTVRSHAASGAAAADFGLPPRRSSAELEMVESRIKGRFEGWDPGTRLQLTNGQVWEVLDNKRVTYDLTEPLVRIKRGLLGSYFMEIDGVTATPRVRRQR